MADASRLLAVFVKEPVPGKVKTRLGSRIGHERAAELYAAFQHDTLEHQHDVAEQQVIYYAPDSESSRVHFESLERSLSGTQTLWAQPEADLGGRLEAVFRRGFTTAGHVAVMGSDSPTLPNSIVATAFEQLAEFDAVVGPAMDGGYYLLGLSRPVHGLFAGIDWSSSRVLLQTLTRLEQAGCTVALLPPWYDVDEIANLATLYAECQKIGASSCRRTAERLRELWPTPANLEQFISET